MKVGRAIPKPPRQYRGYRVYYDPKCYTWHKSWSGIVEKYGPSPRHMIVKIGFRFNQVLLHMSSSN